MTITRNGNFSVVDESRQVSLYQLPSRHWQDHRATGWDQFLLILQERKIGFQANCNREKSRSSGCQLIEWFIVEIGSCYSEESSSSEYKDYSGGEYSYNVRSHIEKSEIMREIFGMLSHYVCHNYLPESGSQLIGRRTSLVMLKSINFDYVCEQKIPPLG